MTSIITTVIDIAVLVVVTIVAGALCVLLTIMDAMTRVAMWIRRRAW